MCSYLSSLSLDTNPLRVAFSLSCCLVVLLSCYVVVLLSCCRPVYQDGATTRPQPPPQTGHYPGATGAAIASTPARFSLSPRAAPSAQYQHGSGVRGVSATPGVGGLRAVAGGMSSMSSVTPRTPVRRWTHEEASTTTVGTGTRSVTKGEGVGIGIGIGLGRGGAVGGGVAAAAVAPPRYSYGMVSAVNACAVLVFGVCTFAVMRTWLTTNCW